MLTTWISGDWYLNQPLLPAAVPSFVWQASGDLGFLATSDRANCWSGVLRVGTLGRKPQLAVTMLAVGLFLYVGRSQGVAAREWLVGT